MPVLTAVALISLFVALFSVAFRHLPRERWQVLAVLPRRKQADGSWSGTNLTYYGLILASAWVLGCAVALGLLGALGLDRVTSALLVGGMLAFAAPASPILARLIEESGTGFTIGGASAVAMAVAPIGVALVRWSLGDCAPDGLRAVPVIAAFSLSHLLGEGVGRLACISFGCCYGKPLAECGPLARRLFVRRSFVFQGATKKIAYAGGLESVRVLPIQGVTSCVHAATFVASVALFLAGHFRTALVVSVAAGYGWRIWSETYRADYRGGGRFSAYQWLAAASIVIAGLCIVLEAPVRNVRADAAAGLALLWHPGVILALQALWLGSFVYTGASRVTGATLRIHVHPSAMPRAPARDEKEAGERGWFPPAPLGQDRLE